MHSHAMLVATVLLIAMGAAGVAAGARGADAAPVRVEMVKESELRDIVRLTGSVTSERRASLSPAIAGLVTQLFVDTGSRVEAGDVLLELDAELAEWDVQSAAADAEAARLALADAQRRLSEARSLAPQQSIAETVIRDLSAEVAEDQALLQRAQAALGYRRALLARHSLKAPFSGLLSNKLTELGEWVAPGEPVLELVATDSLRLDFRVAEEFLGATGPGTRVRYTLGAAPDSLRDAVVDAIVPVSEPGARSFLLRTRAEAADARLVPGMAVHGEMQLDSGRRGLVVPRDAILRYPDGRSVVWAVDTADGQTIATERRITTGLSFDGMVEVLSGLAAGDRVIVMGNEALRPGQPVSVL
ncbi:MAG: efflux RND transporter periplasmic adaptor subunit [Halioglobus sp.]